MAPPTRAETVILLVDDNQQVLYALQRVLESHDYAVLCASSSQEAKALLRQQTPDLILSDVFMPGEDGFCLYDHIRQNVVLNDVPFVFLTAVDSEPHKLQAQREGCDDYLVKPVEPEQLLAVVEGKIARARQIKEMTRSKLRATHKRIIQTLSHEFRTPLVSIQAGAELLLANTSQESADPTTELILEAILAGGKRLQRLVEDFMLLQQLTVEQNSEGGNRTKTLVPLTRLVEETVEGFVKSWSLNSAMQGAQPVVQFSVVEKNDLEECRVAGDYLSEILLRILENALKFGGSERPIGVSVVLDKPYSRVVVRDYGPGFLNEPEAERVFEPFLQIKRQVYEQQGCGVGLTIAQLLAQLSGYELQFSAPGKGSGVAAHILIPVPVDDGESVQQAIL